LQASIDVGLEIRHRVVFSQIDHAGKLRISDPGHDTFEDRFGIAFVQIEEFDGGTAAHGGFMGDEPPLLCFVKQPLDPF